MDEQTLNRALAIIVFGCVGLGLAIMALGPVLSFVGAVVNWFADIGQSLALERARRRNERREAHHLRALQSALAVNDFEDDADDLLSSDEADEGRQTADRQTDERVSAGDRLVDALKVDKTRTGLIALLVYSGWSVAEVRAVLKGDNGTLGAEYAAARERLGIKAESIKVHERDQEYEIARYA